MPRDPALLTFGILGPLEVRQNSHCCAPTAPKQRALLALLVCRSNAVVPTSVLVDGLWGGSPPASAVAALHGHVSAVRRRLDPGPAGLDPRDHPVLQTQTPGYLLRLPPDQLDVTQFRAGVRAARALRDRGRCERAADVLGAALALWRGPALADLRESDALAGPAARLDEEQLAAMRELVAIETCLGRAEQQIGLLEELCARHPLREPFYQLLMVTLSLAGRRAEALAVYSQARRTIVAEVGVEPDAELRRTHRAVLAGVPPQLPGHTGHAAAGGLATRPAGRNGGRRHLVGSAGGRITQSRRRW